MSDEDGGPGAGTPPITFDGDGDQRPWIDHPRLTREQFGIRAASEGRVVQLHDYMKYARLTDRELELLNNLIEGLREGHCDDIGPKFVIKSYGNKARVGWFDHNGELVTFSFEEFRNAYIEKRVEVGTTRDGEPKYIPLAKHWLEHPLTRRYDRVEFRPGRPQEDMPEDVLNLWRGWPEPLQPGWSEMRLGANGPEPSRSTVLDGGAWPTGCERFLEHIHENMCDGDDEVTHFLLGWMADGLCNPGPCETAVVMSGPQGSGKGFWAKRYMEFFGPHSVTLNNPRQLVGNFNKHLLNKSVVFADEAFFAGNRQHAGSLKTLTSDEQIFIEPKGVDGFMAPKMFRIIMASNDPQVILAERDDRRNLALDVDAGEHNADKEYFGRIADEWRAGGRWNLFRWLTGRHWHMAVTEGDFKSWVRPVTKGLNRQKDLALPPAQMVLQNMLTLGEPPCDFVADARAGTVFVATQLLADARRLDERDQTRLGQALHVVAGQGARNTRQYLGAGYQRRRYRGYWLPPLALARQNWERYLGRSVEWPEDVATWAVEAAPMRSETDEAPY